jgi:hypothetical protein
MAKTATSTRLSGTSRPNASTSALSPKRHPCHCHRLDGYEIYSTYITHQNQGGVAIVWRKDAKNWCIESPKRHGPNILSCELVSGEKRTAIIVVCLPPNDLDDLPYLDEALRKFPDCTPIILGDLNVDLNQKNSRATKINAAFAPYGLLDLLLHFKQCRVARNLITNCQNLENGKC